jgi:hypothetical protein
LEYRLSLIFNKQMNATLHDWTELVGWLNIWLSVWMGLHSVKLGRVLYHQMVAWIN